MGNYFSCSLFDVFRSQVEELEAAETPLTGHDEEELTEISNIAIFGAGCYWGTEKYFRKDFCKKYPDTISNGVVGFIGPADSPKNPSYKDVCTGETGHVESFKFEYEGGADMYENLVRFFFQFHDPTVLNKVIY